MIPIGVYPLSEGTFTIAGDHIFVPFDHQHDHIKDRPASLLVEIQPFLVVTASDYILIDPGLGFHLANGPLQIHEALLRLNVQPTQITKVLLSHLHIDHAGGVVQQVLENGEWKWLPTFPNATYYFQQQEWDFAQQKGYPSYDINRLNALREQGHCKVMQGDEWISTYIEASICGGHTPYHQVFKIHSNNTIYFYGGDVVPQFSQLQRKFVAKYDYDGALAAELRKAYAKQAVQENWVCLFFHDIRTPYCKITETHGTYKASAAN